MPSPLIKKTLYGIGLTGWIAAIIAGFWSFHSYERQPGIDGKPLKSWPSKSHLKHTSGSADIVMAVHPRCPCTEASLTILGHLVRSGSVPASIHVLMYRPANSQQNWSEEGKQRVRDAIPTAILVDDPGALEARQFGISASGTVVAFDQFGEPQFTGGVTKGRNLIEASAGGESVADILCGLKPQVTYIRTFGCALFAMNRKSPVVGEIP